MAYLCCPSLGRNNFSKVTVQYLGPVNSVHSASLFCFEGAEGRGGMVYGRNGEGKGRRRRRVGKERSRRESVGEGKGLRGKGWGGKE